MVYLVRHAHAGKKANWTGPDQARPLSAQGRKEALGLIDRLGGRPLGRVVSSPAERCLQTVQPLAGRLGRPVEPDEALGVEGTAAGVLDLLTGRPWSGRSSAPTASSSARSSTSSSGPASSCRTLPGGPRAPPGYWSSTVGMPGREPTWSRWPSSRPPRTRCSADRAGKEDGR